MLGGTDVIEVGERITLDDGHTLRLKKKIGDGFTAIIYIAEPEDKSWRTDDMVLKIAKPNTKTYVEEEYSTLIKLSNEIIENGQPITPRIYGKAIYGEYERFIIAMELIKGSPILGRDDLVKREEKDVLKIYQDVYSFLDKLHKIGMTYPDLKLDNFFWDDSDPEARIRVLDFGAMGTTSDPANDPQCHREIFRLALGMFASLTGRRLFVDASGQVQENIARSLAGYPISTGTKQLMTGLLTKQKDYRLTLASKVKDEIEVLRRLWEFNQEELFRAFEGNLGKGESLSTSALENSRTVFKDKKDYAERAAYSIDIYQLRFGKSEGLSEEIHGKLKELQLATSYLSEAKRAFVAGDNNRALENLKEGEALSDKPEIFLMWQYLFSEAYLLSEAEFPLLFSATEDLLDSYTSGNMHAAKLLVNEAMKDFPSYTPLTSISNYIGFIEALAQSDVARSNGDYQAAIDAYDNAEKWFESLPHKEYLQKNYYPDFSDRRKVLADESDIQLRESQRPRITWQEASALIKAGEISKIIDHYHAAIRYGGIQQDQQDILVSAIKDQLSASKTKEARMLAGLIDYFDLPMDKLVELRSITKQIEQIEHTIFLGDIPHATEQISNLSSNQRDAQLLNPVISNLLGKISRMDLRGMTDEAIQGLSAVAKRTGNREIVTELSAIAKNRAEDNKKRIEPALRQIELDLLPTQYWYLELDQFLDELTTRNYMAQLARVDDQKSLLDSTTRRIDFLKSIEITDRNQRESLGKFEAEANRRRSILDDQSAVLPEFKNSFEEHLKVALDRWKDIVHKYGLQSGDTARVTNGGSLEELVGEVYRVVKVMTESDRLFGSDAIPLEIVSQVFLAYDLLGAPAWERLLSVEDQMPADVAETINQIKVLISSGDANGASRKIQSLDTMRQLYPEVQLLRIQVLKILSFSKNLDKFKPQIDTGSYSEDLLNLIVNADGLNLPKTFFDRHRLSMYVMNLLRSKRSVLKMNLDMLRRSISNNEEPDPAASHLLSEYVLLKSALNVIENKGGNNGKGN